MKSIKYFLFLVGLVVFTQCRDNDPMMELEPEIDLCLEVDCGENGECIDGSCLCEEDYFGENCEKKKGLIKSISKDGILKNEFDYAPDYTLKTLKFISLNGVDAALTYVSTWLGDTVRVDLEEEPGFHMMFYVKNENQVVQDEIYMNALESRDLRIYNDCGISQHLSYYDDDVLQYIDEYEFIDDNCSFTQIDGNRKNTVLMDSNKGTGINSGFGLFYNSLIDYQLESYGNVIQSTVEIDDIIQEAISFTCEYQFNDHGYPIKNTVTYLDGNVEVWKYAYYD